MPSILATPVQGSCHAHRPPNKLVHASPAQTTRNATAPGRRRSSTHRTFISASKLSCHTSRTRSVSPSGVCPVRLPSAACTMAAAPPPGPAGSGGRAAAGRRWGRWAVGAGSACSAARRACEQQQLAAQPLTRSGAPGPSASVGRHPDQPSSSLRESPRSSRARATLVSRGGPRAGAAGRQHSLCGHQSRAQLLGYLPHTHGCHKGAQHRVQRRPGLQARAAPSGRGGAPRSFAWGRHGQQEYFRLKLQQALLS